MATPSIRYPNHIVYKEPELLFHPTRMDDISAHPLLGLRRFGPYSRSLINHVIDPIRVAVIAPSDGVGAVRKLIGELDSRQMPMERKAYLQEFPGYAQVFGVRVVVADPPALVTLPAEVDQQVARLHPHPHLYLAEQLTRAITAIEGCRHLFDVLLVYLPDRWERAFYGGEGEDFDLHDYLKAVTAVRAIPLQVLKESSAMQYRCRCSVMWRLGLAFYVKAGGIPWKLAAMDETAAYIGLSYAVRRSDDGKPRFVTCCSQVFDADGAGLEFIVYESEDVRIENDNPFLSRGDMRRVLARSITLYQRRHAGRKPKQLIVHKTTPFKRDEILGCFDAWQAPQGLDLIQVQQQSPWRGVEYDLDAGRKNVVPSGYPCQRGSCLHLSDRDILVWTQGNSRQVVAGKNFYKEGKGTPSPLLLTRFAGHGSWDINCNVILGLTKMNWNH